MEPRSGGEARSVPARNRCVAMFPRRGPLWGLSLSLAMEPRSGGEARSVMPCSEFSSPEICSSLDMEPRSGGEARSVPARNRCVAMFPRRGPIWGLSLSLAMEPRSGGEAQRDATRQNSSL
jgi:hypothetical protein